jgi:hypothetical protein
MKKEIQKSDLIFKFKTSHQKLGHRLGWQFKIQLKIFLSQKTA